MCFFSWFISGGGAGTSNDYDVTISESFGRSRGAITSDAVSRTASVVAAKDHLQRTTTLDCHLHKCIVSFQKKYERNNS